MKYKLFCIAGETASGKDSMCRKIIKKFNNYNIKSICSYTDRPKRDKEIDGVEHYFLSTEEFNKIRNENPDKIIAYTNFNNTYQYMSTIDNVKEGQIYLIDPEGIKYLKDNFSDIIDIVIVYIYAPFEDRKNRAHARSDYKTAFMNRVKSEENSFNYFKERKKYDYLIDNRDGNYYEALSSIYEIFKTEMLKSEYINKPSLKTNI